MRYFVADIHAGDPSITKYRKQFQTLAEHDAMIWELLASATKNDIVTFVGDCFIKPHTLDILRKLPFKKELVAGNHCFEKGVRFSDLVGIMDRIDGVRKWKHFWLSHAPLHPHHLRNRLNIHGHLHEVIIPDRRFINVSLEASGYRLVSHEEILDGSYRTYSKPYQSRINSNES
jgi:calcineurin-like phosphoesterase family protein